MKMKFFLLGICLIIFSCISPVRDKNPKSSEMPIMGTWKLISGTTIEKGDTTITYYNRKLSFIKIINQSHFAFLNHDLTKGKDTAAVFVAGGGSYSIKDSLYTEHLEYCSDRQWEGNDFSFTVSIKNDTLIQSGIEKVESAGVNRINIEKYIRLNN